ncbi:MAG: hypothetical protein A3I54_00225 [Candidatus Levybacteria bacterium RIFCSPLOWO2_02_FULL_41_11]|nr:MAG: hypothetical protein A3I54_00225 [Candidatus Levybacteria bacterium RIFCSPLOWO2_02_FULL_41_11]
MKDMNRLPDLLRNYLLSKKAFSPLTSKNYVSDIRKFIHWFEQSFGKNFQAQDFTPDVITLFEKTHGAIITPDAPDTLDTRDTLRISSRSFKRYFSSLRKFALFLVEEGYLEENPFNKLMAKSQQSRTKQDPWFLKDFKDYLYIFGASNLTIKNYLVDLNAFTNWAENAFKTDLNISKDYISSITSEIIDAYKQRLILLLRLSPKTVNRKLSSIRKYLEFASSRGYIGRQFPISPSASLGAGNFPDFPKASRGEQFRISEEGMKLQDIEEEETGQTSQSKGGQPLAEKIPPVRLLQRLLTPYVFFEDIIASKIAELIKHKKLSRKAEISSNRLPISVDQKIKNIPARIPLHKQLIYHARYTRPKWYKTYHSYSFSHYFHLAILIIYASIVGFLIYNNLFPEPSQTALAVPAGAKKVLSFQGRLTDSSDNPITNPTDIRFALYENATATGSALLWQEVHHALTPSKDGVFSILLGTKNDIDGSLFRDHDLLWLGISVGTTQELIPRQRIAAVSYAANSETLSGMLSITDPSAGATNVVLALDSSGKLTMGGTASPTFAATGGRFKLSGTTLSLSTEESSSGDVDISPDGIGKIDLQKPIINDTANGNLSGGAVEINDKVAILATESAVAAFVINNMAVGDLITASASGIQRFTLANDGDLTLNGADTITASSLSTFTTAEILSFSQDLAILGNDITNATLNLGGGGAATLGTVSDDNLTITPNGNGELTLTSDFDTGVNIGASTNTQALLSISGGIGSNAALIVNQTNSGDIFSASSSGTTKFVLGSSGTITLTSGIAESSSGQYLCIDTTTYEVGRSNAACSASSERFKENIKNLSLGLDEVMNLRPVTFTFKPGLNLGSDSEVGFIAEEVEKVIPELVSYDREGRPSGVNYPNMTALLTRAIQELAQKLETTTQSFTTMGGQDLRDYISQLINEAISQKSQVINPLASIEQIHTNVISPLSQGSEIAVSLDGSKFKIHESTAIGSAVVASIDNQGNARFSGDLEARRATFSGQLSAESLQSERASVSGELTVDNVTANQASVSGTLFADRIIANDIEGLDDRIATVAGSLQSGQWSVVTGQLLDIESISSDFATFRAGLISLGPATFAQATVLDSLSIGTSLVLGPNSIDTLGQTLEIQPLKQGAISFMAGLVRIEVDGTLKVLSDAEFAGNVKVQGKLSANIVSPISDDPLVIARSPSESEGDEAISTNSALLDVQGSASVSGALTSRKINLAFAQQALATSDIEAIATGSAGTAILPKFRKELTIKNPNVTENSLIYITPVGNTNNKVLYLLRQAPEDYVIDGLEGSFTVGVSSASTVTDIKFNWIIIN